MVIFSGYISVSPLKRNTGIYCKKKFLRIAWFLLTEEKFEIFNIISTARYIEDVWTQKCVLALIFANAFQIAHFAKLKTCNKFPLYSMTCLYPLTWVICLLSWLPRISVILSGYLTFKRHIVGSPILWCIYRTDL